MAAAEQDATVIGKDVRIRGELSGTHDIYIDGDVEGTVSFPDSKFTVGPNGRVHANVSARDVIVHGRVDGHLRASARVDLRQSAQVMGDITAARLSIEDSAVIKGRVELSQHPAPGSPSVQASPATGSATPEMRRQESGIPVGTGAATAK